MKTKLMMTVMFALTVVLGTHLAVEAQLPIRRKAPDQKEPKEPKQPDAPKTKTKPDLAAWKINAGLSGGINEGAKTTLVGYVKNLGSVKFAGGRTVSIQYKTANGTWKTAASGPVPPIFPGQVVHVLETAGGSPATQPGMQTRLVISAGDNNAGNDILVSKNVPLPNPK